ncbi:MAG: protein phosphatase 2C domain-containing protein [Bacteriovoracaceae bacterium]|nr:protein phosphatase 2C domain-containing protein [Bacteriovoracaceae bacterium]
MKLKSYAALTHQGPFLESNEDGYDFDLDQQFFFVLDGFGGSGVGDKAVGKLKDDLKSYLSQLTSDPDSTMPLYWSPRWLLEGNAMINAMLNSHQKLFKENSQKSLNQRAGASAACAIKSDDILVLSQVGSCQAFLARHGTVEALFLPDTHQLLSQDAHAPTSLKAPVGAFGFFPELSWHMKEVRVQEGDQFLFLTEGIAPWLSLTELGHALSRQEEDGHQKLNALLKLSNSRGNCANQTAMILEF